MNYYYFASDNSLQQLIQTLQHADRIINGMVEGIGK